MLSTVATTFAGSLVHITGFLVVLLALLILWGMTAAVGRLFIGAHAGTPAAEKKGQDDLTEEEVAAIAACVAAIIGRRSRIVSIRRGRKTDWNREGRREHFSSRRLR